MLTDVRRLCSACLYSVRKNHRKGGEHLSKECTVIQNVEAATRDGIPVDDTKPPRKPMKRCARPPWSNILLCAIMVGVGLLLFSPVIVFYLPRDFLGFEQVTSTSDVTINKTACTSQEYSGRVCLTELQQQYYCGGGSGPVFISSDVDQEAQETEAQQILTGLQFLNPSSECLKAFRPFFCLFLFSVCDGSGHVVQPSYQDCVALRDDICAEEIQRAITLLGSDLFPPCESFPQSETSCYGGHVSGSGEEILSTVMSSTLNESDTNGPPGFGEETNIDCSDGFYFENSSQVCKPECGVWTHFTPKKEEVMIGLRLFASSLGIVSSLLVLILSCAQYKRMFKFPTIFIVYQTVAVLIYSFLNISGWVWRKKLLCVSRDLITSLENTTVKCKIIGGVFVYLLGQVELWLLFHTTITMCGVVWPIKYKYYKKYYTKHIHVGALVLGAVLPIVPALVAVLKEGYRLTFVTHYDCTLVNVNMALYGVVLPAELVIITAMFMLFIILRRITSWKCLKSIGSKRNEANAAEIKILIIILYYIFLSLYTITISIVTFLEEDPFVTEVKQYYLCEASGVKAATSCSKKQFDKFDGVSKVFAHILIGSYPLIFLVYIVQIKTCMTKIKGALQKVS